MLFDVKVVEEEVYVSGICPVEVWENVKEGPFSRRVGQSEPDRVLLCRGRQTVLPEHP